MNRETIRKRINALRERTTARGCTEAEAVEAATKAAALMREHGLSGDGLDMAEEAGPVKASDKRHRLVLWGIIAGCTNTAAMTRELLAGFQVVYVGREPGPEIAVYLLDVCNNAIDAELARFRRGDFYRSRRKASTRRKAAADFTVALVQRLCRRLDDMFADNRDHAAARKAMAELDRRFPFAKSSQPARRHKVTYESAAADGWKAGGRVHLGHGVRGGADDPLLIGRD